LKNNNSTSIVIGGDICPIRSNQKLFEEGSLSNIYNDLLPVFKKSDLGIVNLECPLIDAETPIKKTGPVFGVSSECINGLMGTGIDVLGLANNHILDHGEEGLLNTLQVAKENDLLTVGAGINLGKAGKILKVVKNGLKIGIIAVAEHEWSIASPNRPGANPIDVIEFTRLMQSQKRELDYVIVLLHGGYQYYPYPSPNLQKLSRFMIEMGANAVICQHSHCAGCMEKYREGYIIYGQGDFIFDTNNQNKSRREGVLVNLVVDKDKKTEIDLIPFKQSGNHPGVRKMNHKEADKFLNAFKLRSQNIKESGFVEKEWEKFCSDKRYNYFSILRGHNKMIKTLNKYLHFTDWFYSKKNKKTLKNVTRCESHQEALKTIL